MQNSFIYRIWNIESRLLFLSHFTDFESTEELADVHFIMMRYVTYVCSILDFVSHIVLLFLGPGISGSER